jgi:hypothetical protein
MMFEADEAYSSGPPAFVWKASFPRRRLPIAFGRDEYADGEGSILIKALGIYPLANEAGDELAAAGLLRYLNEMIWFPAAYLGDNVSWAAIDDRSALVTLTDRGITVSGTFFFDGEGRPTNFRALRFNTATRKMETWETPLTTYQTLAGLNLPVTGTAVWKLADGDFTYIGLRVTDVVYDDTPSPRVEVPPPIANSRPPAD